MSNPLKIIFAGTPDFAAQQLYALLDSVHTITAILSQSRNLYLKEKKIKLTLIEKISKQYNIPMYQPKSLKSQEILEIIYNLNADIIVVSAYGLIFPEEILNIPRLGCINLHYSLLPRWRGAAPIQRAIEAGDNITGITIIQMNKGIDTGDMLYQKTYNITPDDTNISVCKKLSKMGSIALIKIVNKLNNNKYTGIKQNEKLATYANKISKKEGEIKWNIPAIQIERCIRAFNPWPSCFFRKKGHIIKIWKATTYHILTQDKYYKNTGIILQISKNNIDVTTGYGILSLLLIQIEGKKIMSIHEILNYRKEWFQIGSKITD